MLSSPEVACGKTIFIVLSSVLSEWTTIMSVSCTSASSEKIRPGYYFKMCCRCVKPFLTRMHKYSGFMLIEKSELFDIAPSK